MEKETLQAIRDIMGGTTSLPAKYRVELYDAVVNYVLGIEPEIASSLARGAFLALKGFIDQKMKEIAGNDETAASEQQCENLENDTQCENLENDTQCEKAQKCDSMQKTAKSALNAKNGENSIEGDNDPETDAASPDPQAPSPSRARIVVYNKNKEDINIIDNQKIKKEPVKKESEKSTTPQPALFAECEGSPPAQSPAADTREVKAMIADFNDTLAKAGAIVPHNCSYTHQRAVAIGARVREHGRQGFKLMVQKAAQSDFLNGRNKHNWVANFDWLLRPTNFTKVIEGNYDNDKTTGNNLSDDYGDNNYNSANIYTPARGYAGRAALADPRRGTPAGQHAAEEY